MGLVLRRNKGQSIEIFSPSDEAFGVIKITPRCHGNIEIDAPKHLAVMRSELCSELSGKAIEPQPVTKKICDILADHPSLRVWGVTRETAECVLMLSWHWSEWSHLEMAWCDGAWSCRPVGGVYQQIMVFVPEDDND